MLELRRGSSRAGDTAAASHQVGGGDEGQAEDGAGREELKTRLSLWGDMGEGAGILARMRTTHTLGRTEPRHRLTEVFFYVIALLYGTYTRVGGKEA